MHNYKIYQLVLILSPFVFSFAFGLDIYIPIVPQMTEIFDTSAAMVHLTLSLFLFTTGVGQLLIGPLADQIGRKPTFYLSTLCYAFGSMGCAYSSTIEWMIMARLISSFGACGMLVTSFALVRDLYSSEQSGIIYSFLNGAIGISPTFAPIIGGHLATAFGWESIFYFLACIGLVAFCITGIYIKETHPVAQRIKMDRAVFHRYLEIFTHPQFLIFALIAGLGEAVFFCFFSISPFIIIELLGVPTPEFGYYFAVFGSVIGLGGLTSGKLIEKWGIHTTIKLGIVLLLLGGVSMILWHAIAALSLAGFLIPMAVACMGAMFLVGSSASACLEPFGLIAGTASAAFGATQFSISAIGGAILMLFPINSTVPYGISIILMALLSMLLFGQRYRIDAIEPTQAVGESG